MLSFEQMRSKLAASLNEHRYLHSIGVMDTAVELAHQFGADVEKCRIAGLLHDCAKKLSVSEMLDAIKQADVELYPGEADYPQLLHAPAGRALAMTEYGVDDEEILSAIRCHTVGSKNMSLIDTIIFVADFIEPNRKPFDGLERVRQAARTDLYAAAKLCKRLTDDYCASSGQKPFSF